MTSRQPAEPLATPDFATRAGLATLGPDALALRTALETRFLTWAEECGAQAYSYPPLLGIEDLNRLDYFENFPHLAVLGTGLRPEAAERYAESGAPGPVVPASDLALAGYALPSAACYSVYLSLSDQTLPAPARITTVATCFRREDHFDGLRRLLSFSMREIVCVGERDEVLDHLTTFKRRILGFLEAIGLPVAVEKASDPFFDRSGSRALLQQLFPVKEEFVYGDDLAIASVNFHRNFFGERCGIRAGGGEHAFSGCVAFGLERWISALSTHVGGDLRRLSALVTNA